MLRFNILVLLLVLGCENKPPILTSVDKLYVLMPSSDKVNLNLLGIYKDNILSFSKGLNQKGYVKVPGKRWLLIAGLNKAGEKMNLLVYKLSNNNFHIINPKQKVGCELTNKDSVLLYRIINNSVNNKEYIITSAQSFKDSDFKSFNLEMGKGFSNVVR